MLIHDIEDLEMLQLGHAYLEVKDDVMSSMVLRECIRLLHKYTIPEILQANISEETREALLDFKEELEEIKTKHLINTFNS